MAGWAEGGQDLREHGQVRVKMSVRELGGAYNINKTPNNQHPADSYQTPRLQDYKLQVPNCKTIGLPATVYSVQTARLQDYIDYKLENCTLPSNSRMPHKGAGGYF